MQRRRGSDYESCDPLHQSTESKCYGHTHKDADDYREGFLAIDQVSEYERAGRVIDELDNGQHEGTTQQLEDSSALLLQPYFTPITQLCLLCFKNIAHPFSLPFVTRTEAKVNKTPLSDCKNLK